MRIAIAPATFPHETAFLERFAATCVELGHYVTVEPEWLETELDLLVQWGAKSALPAGLGWAGPTIHIELAWLPRWHYQVSWTGINAKHHAAGGRMEVTSTHQNRIDATLHSIRSGSGMPEKGWHYCDPTVPAYEGLAPFWLCPLQVPGDVNMDSLPESLRTPEGLIGYVISRHYGDPARIYFKQHPAMSERRQHFKIKPPHKFLKHDTKHQIASYLKSPNCLGVICGNSNVFHDALLWGKPATALGDGFWGKGPITMQPGTDETNAYLRHVLANQWTLEMANDPARVAVLIGDALSG